MTVGYRILMDKVEQVDWALRQGTQGRTSLTLRLGEIEAELKQREMDELTPSEVRRISGYIAEVKARTKARPTGGSRRGKRASEPGDRFTRVMERPSLATRGMMLERR